ncbi:MAG TPA: hypothetical protein VGK44_07975 [Casimicrobiaceae bacterium]|jgi:hypothetical protein
MTGAIKFVKIVFLLFLFQDVVNVVLVKVGLIDAIPAFSSIKEVLVIGLLGWHWLGIAPTRPLDITSVVCTVVLAICFAVGVWRGIERFPLDGVVFELRTLALPILIYFWGKAFVEAGDHPLEKVESLVRFYVNASVLFALSSIVDYFFLSEDFWTWVDVGSVARAKGYIAASSGALPDNMYSFFFGRRAFGLAFNPLNLAYMLIPALLFAFYRREIVRFAIALAAFVLSFSRLPILVTAAVVGLAAVPRGLRWIAVILGSIGVGIAVYAARALLFEDPSASGHFADVALGLLAQLINPLGEGVGAAGVYAGNYSSLSVESAALNTANQITVIGLAAYVLIFWRALGTDGPLHREMRMMAAIYAITAIFAPQLLVIRSTFAFFFFLGANAALGNRSSHIATVQPIGQRQAV